MKWTPYPALRMAFGVVVLLSAVPTVHAQDVIITDRPDFTESGVSVPVGKVQIEGGVSSSEFGNGNLLVFPETLARIGVASGLEIRLGLPSYQDQDRISGFGDASLGAKLEIQGVLPGWQTAVIAAVGVPTGEENIGSDGFNADVILAAGRDLDDTYSFGTQIMASVSEDDGSSQSAFGGTLVVSRPVAEALGIFVELAGTRVDGSSTEAFFHLGFVYFLQNNVQFDIHAALGLTDESPDSLIGAGLSVVL